MSENIRGTKRSNMNSGCDRHPKVECTKKIILVDSWKLPENCATLTDIRMIAYFAEAEPRRIQNL